MRYNEAIFGEKLQIYMDSQRQNKGYVIGTMNNTLSAGFKSGAFPNNTELPEDIFYWQIGADSPYNGYSYAARIGVSGAYQWVPFIERNQDNLAIYCTAGRGKVDEDYNVTDSGTYNTYYNNDRITFSQSAFKTTGITDPLWFFNESLPTTTNPNGYYDAAPIIADFDYNNVILVIYINGNQTLDTFIKNNNNGTKITEIAYRMYCGERDSSTTIEDTTYPYKMRQLIFSENYTETGSNRILSGGNGYNAGAIRTDHRYPTPTFIKANAWYDQDEFIKMGAMGGNTGRTVLFQNSITTSSNITSISNPSFWRDLSKWDFDNNGWFLKMSGDNKYSEEDFNYIRGLIAWLGFWFTDGGTYIDEETGFQVFRYNSLLGEDANNAPVASAIPDHVYQAVIEDGTTTGEFIELRIAKDNEQSKWGKDWREKNGYEGKTHGGDRPKPDPAKNPLTSKQPGFSLAIDNGSINYTLTKTDWRQIWNDIYGGSKSNWKNLIEGLSLYGANPLNAILNYRWYPFLLKGTQTAPIRLGATIVRPRVHKYSYIDDNSEAYYTAYGSLFVGDWSGFDINFINTKKTKCRLFLPWYGFYELPMTLVLTSNIQIEFAYNLPDDNGLWIIKFNGSVYDYVECQPFIELPITGDNSLQIAAAKAQRNLSIAMTAGAAVAGALIGGAAGLTQGVIASGFGTAADVAEQGILGTVRALSGDAFYSQIGMAAGGALAGAAVPLATGGVKAANTVMQSALQIGTLSTNVPVHSSGSDTTFLHLQNTPLIEFYTNDTIDGFNESQYKLKTGIACDMWKTTSAMPDDTLLAATGTADMDTSGMTLAEVQELNQILQNGFYK